MSLNYHNWGIGTRLKHPEFGLGVLVDMDSRYYSIVFVEKGLRQIATSFDSLEVIEVIPSPEKLVTRADLEKIFTRLLRQFSDISETVELSDKWQGGKIILQPGKPNLATKEIPIDTFFHKIVMLRDRLRVMEQKINAHKLLTDIEKVELQQYLTRIYGTLTTFNVLFKDTAAHFVGTKESE
jgi:hypothetical protein